MSQISAALDLNCPTFKIGFHVSATSFFVSKITLVAHVTRKLGSIK